MDIAVNDIRKTYGRSVAVDGLTFRVEPGRVTGFLGPNGAGKSTTMRMILGLDRPDRGTATINGRRYADLDHPLRHVGALLEARALHPGRSARDHLVYLAQTNDIPRQRVDAVLEQVGLAPVAAKRVKSYSLGMGQRLGIAVALLGDPDVLVLDEPVNGLDVEGVRWIRGLLKGLAGQGRAVLLSSHLLGEMSMTADHLVVIAKGRLIADCSTDEFLARGAGRSVHVKSPDLAQLLAAVRRAGGEISSTDGDVATITSLSSPEIGVIAAKEGLVLSELMPSGPSLEEAFVEITSDVAMEAGV